MKFLQQELDKWKARCSQLQSDKDKLAEEAKSLHTRLQDMEDVTQGSSLQPHGFGTLQDNQDMTNKLDDGHSEDEMREAPNDDHVERTSDLNVAIEQAVSETVIEYQAIIQQMKIDHQQELDDKDDHYSRVIDDNQQLVVENKDLHQEIQNLKEDIEGLNASNQQDDELEQENQILKAQLESVQDAREKDRAEFEAKM